MTDGRTDPTGNTPTPNIIPTDPLTTHYLLMARLFSGGPAHLATPSTFTTFDAAEDALETAQTTLTHCAVWIEAVDGETLYCEHCGRPLTDAEADAAVPVDGEMWCATCAETAMPEAVVSPDGQADYACGVKP